MTRGRARRTPPIATALSGRGVVQGHPAPDDRAVVRGHLGEPNFAALGAFEAYNGRWGVATDMIFMNLGATLARELLGQREIAVDSRLFVAEAAFLLRIRRGEPRDGMEGF